MKTTSVQNLLAFSVALAACRADWTGTSVQGSLVEGDDPPLFSDWSAPVDLGPPVNTTVADVAPFISKDGLSLYFGVIDAPGGFGGEDIWVSQRISVDAPWGPPQNLGATINSAAAETGPRLSVDGHHLYFASNRAGFGGNDLYVARRKDKRDPLGWQNPVNLGSAVNTSANESTPTFFEDGATGTITMYFDSDRPGRGDLDLYSSALMSDGTLTPAVLVEDLSTSSRERQPTVRRDGLEMIFVSNRLPRVGMTDLWVATRATTSDPWSAPENLGPVVNTTFVDSSPALSHDGTALYFHSNANRPGGMGPCFGDEGPCFFDIYVTTRSKWKGEANNASGSTDDRPRFSDWSAPLNLAVPVNSPVVEGTPFISKDGLSLYFAAGRGRLPNCGSQDIWVSQRTSVDEPWGPPQNLGCSVNSAAHDNEPTLSPDGHLLLFTRTEGSVLGVGQDLYVSRRHDKRDDLGWQTPVKLGGAVNSTANESGAALFEDGVRGTMTLYFVSDRQGGRGGSDIYASTLDPDQTFGVPVLVEELSSPLEDVMPAIRRDGLEILLASDRTGTLGNLDLWVATRASGLDPWSLPVNLGSGINSAFFDGGPALSFRGTELYFQSAFRPENVGGPMFDIWVATRSKVKGPD